MKRLPVMLCLFAQLAVAVPAAQAQAITADSIQAFVGTFLSQLMAAGETRPALRLAALPTRWPELRIPPGTTVAGSVEFPWASYAVLTSSDMAATVVALESGLEAAGWARRRAAFPSEGDGRGDLYCRGAQSVVISARQNDGTAFLVFTPGPAMSLCDRPEPAASEIGPFVLPSLAPPPGAEYRAGNSGMGERDQYFVAHLESDGALEEIAEYYGAELRAAGAELGRVLSAPDAVVAPFRLRDQHDRSWVGTLTVRRGTQARTRHVHVFVAR